MDAKYKEFLELYIEYTDYTSKNPLPGPIGSKLDYLGKSIVKLPTNQVPELSEQELRVLQTLDFKDKLLLFIQMVKCILGKDSTIIENKEAFIKKNKYFEKWELCYISFDVNNIIIMRRNREVFPINTLRVSKQVKLKGSKYVFRIRHTKKKSILNYVVGFEKEYPAVQLQSKLYQLTKSLLPANGLNNPNETMTQQATDNSPSKKHKESVLSSDSEDDSPQKEEEQTRVSPSKNHRKIGSNLHIVDPPIHKAPNKITPSAVIAAKDQIKQQPKLVAVIAASLKVNEESSFEKEKWAKIVRDFDLDTLELDEGFRIEDGSEHGKLMSHLTKPNVTKAVVFVNNFKWDIVGLLELFNNSKEWNKEIEDSKITSKVDENVFVLYEKHKAYGFNWRARDFVLIRKAYLKKSANRLYLVQNSISHAMHPEGSTVVRAHIHNRVTVFIRHPKTPEFVTIITRMEVDYRGLNSAEDNKKMAMRYLRNYMYFASYVVQKSYSSEQTRILYNFAEPSVVSIKEAIKQADSASETTAPSRGNSQNEKRSSDKYLSEGSPSKGQQSPPVLPAETIQPTALTLQQLMPRYEEDPFAQRYLVLVTQKQKHQDLCLKFRYDFDVRKDCESKLHKNSPDTDDNFIFQKGDWIVGKDKQFTFMNKAVMDAQKDVLKFIIRQIGTNLLSGKSIMNMSMPVDIFDNRGLLERNAGSKGYAPIFLGRAGKLTDPLQQMKLVATYMISTNLLELRVEKPFNPILGETFQCYLSNIPVYYEQISHHPPISAYYMKCPEFEYYGNLVSFAELGLNSGTGGNAGISNIKFPINDSHYEISLAGSEISGLVYGDRKMKLVGKGFVLNRANNMFCQISLGKDKKDLYPFTRGTTMFGSDIVGGIYKVTPEFINKYTKAKSKFRFQGITKKDVIEQYSKIEGSWAGDVIIDDKVFKTLLEPAPYKVEYHTTPLPSNSNFRQDLIWKRLSNLAMSQSAKEKLENLQRQDKKLRNRK